MSHDLRHNSLQKPIGEQYDRPEENEGSAPKPRFAAGNQFSMIRKFYWRGTNQKSDPLPTNFLHPYTQQTYTQQKRSRIPSLPFFLLGMILSGLANVTYALPG